MLYRNQSGQSLIELLVAIGLLAVLLPALATGMASSREGKAQEDLRLRAVGLLREEREAAKSVLDGSWNTFAVNGTYHPVISGSAWSLVSGSEVVGDYTRQLVISDVQRDSSGLIVTSGGTVDPSTKKIVYTVSWAGGYTGSTSETEYVQRYRNNTSWNQTTQAQFNGGTLTNTVTTNNAGGEVQLAAGTGGNWATPTIAGTYNVGGNADGLAVYVSGNYAYVGSSNAASSSDFTIVNISNPSSPTLSAGLNLSTNVTGVYVSGNYAYLSTQANSSELIIVNITNKSAPSVTSTLDLGSTQDAVAIYVSGNYAYVTKQAGSGANRELYVVNISNPASPSEVGSYEVGSNVNSVYVAGIYAYIATDDNANELIILNISNPTSPSLVGSYNSSGNANGQSVVVSGSTAYLATANNAGSGAEFYIINVSNPASPSLTGSYNAGNNVFGVTVSGNYAFLAGDANNLELQVINIATPASPTLYGSVDLNGGGNAVSVSGDYAYVGNDNNATELAIVLGGPGFAYATSGTIESSTFDAGALVGFNYLTFTVTKPAGTNVVFQLAVNNDNATWNYVGSYTTAGAIPLSSVSGRYIRYKATLSGDGTVTPVVSDVGVNYSP